MNKITWNDLKYFNSWDNLYNSKLTWQDLNKDCSELLNLIIDNNLPIPPKFLDRIEEIYNLSILAYDKHSPDKGHIKEDKTIIDKIKTIGIVITILAEIINISNSTLELIDKIKNDKEQIETQINEINIDLHLYFQDSKNSNTANIKEHSKSNNNKD